MNPIKDLLKFQVNFSTLPFFGAALGGLFGGSAPDYPNLGELTATRASTDGVLFDTSFNFNAGNKSGKSAVNLTGLGQEIADSYKGIFDTAQSDYTNFDQDGWMNERAAILRRLLGSERNASTNQLFDRVNAATGGLAATTGGIATLTAGTQALDRNADRTMLDLLDDGDNYENMLFGRLNPSLSAYSNFLGQGENVATRDVGAWQAMTNSINQQRMGQYQSDYQDYADDQAFWGALGAPLDAALGSAVSSFVPSLFNSTPAINTGGSNVGIGNGNYLAGNFYSPQGRGSAFTRNLFNG